jgi:hypothetical protein
VLRVLPELRVLLEPQVKPELPEPQDQPVIPDQLVRQDQPV